MAARRPVNLDVQTLTGRWHRVRGRVLEDRRRQAPIMTGTVQDITSEKQTESQLLHAQKMETMGALAAGVAHDFNNLLTALANCTDLAIDDLEAGDTESAIRHLNDIQDVTTRARALTRQLLAFSHRQTLQVTEVDLKQLLEGVLRMIRRLLPAHVAIEQELPESSPYVNADPGQLEQVIINLCVNAGDAMPDGGTLRLRLLESALGPDGAEVEVHVEDTGTGMSPEVLARAREPFFTTKGSGRGTGLGLAMAQTIIARHGAGLDIESAVGVGTRIRIRIPVLDHAPEVAPRLSDTRELAPRQGHAHILLVEDDAKVRKVAGRALKRAGYRVSSAADGAEAVELFEQTPHEFDLVFSDVMMPHLKGTEACAIMARTRPDLPILLCSGYSADELQGPDVPKHVFLNKPYSARDLLQTISEVLTGGARLATQVS